MNPGKICSLSLAMFVVHLGRAPKIVVATDYVHRHKPNAAKRPTKVLHEFLVLGVLRLALDLNRRSTKTPSFGKEHATYLGQAVDRVKRRRCQEMAVSPIVITWRQNERMAHTLKRVVDKLVVLISAWHRACCRIVPATVIFKVADMNNER